MTFNAIGIANRAINATGSNTPPSTIHTVQRGQTLSGIAAQYGVSLQALKAANPNIRNANVIFPGDKVNVPAGGANHHTVQRGDTLGSIAKLYGTTVNALDVANPQIRNINRIYPGDTITLPANTSAASARPVARPATQPAAATSEASVVGQSTATANLRAMFNPARGSDALAAIIIGNAEGTRTPNGGRTSAYAGHIDPGNGKGNRGSFSYQHGTRGTTPQQADVAQLTKLTGQIPTFEAAARRAGIDPNNITVATAYFDLFNQSESAAGRFLNQLSYLNEAGISNQSVTELRFRSFVDASTGSRFRFPSGSPVGGGFANIASNNLARQGVRRSATEAEVQTVIRADQSRRQNAMARAIAAQAGNTAPSAPARPAANASAQTAPQHAEAIRFPANRGLDLPQSVIRQANALHDNVRDATGYRINVTSGYRNPARQARAMYDNMVKGTEAQYTNQQAYSEIRAAYSNGKRAGLNGEQIVARMTTVIQGQVDRGVFISKHQIAKGLDISTPPASLSVSVLQAIRSDPNVQSVLREGNHYHIQFK